ncbi:cell envelope integrity protein CreD [Thaumasiovibrio subtropicus]|uniref:cell envelope integrity protein CreD n=1 Tax=Thaumasiovibrio subtropicus TaxID=1891207 RepID=UPI00131CE8D7|nr:cell envelope integrity protein CreD [Thaumasiovibrio subtropicus]
MKYQLAKKVLFLVLSGFVAIFALGAITNLIHERLYYQSEAKQSVANSWSDQQQLLGPFLVIQYQYQVLTPTWNKESESYIDKPVKKEAQIYLIPEKMHINATMSTQERSRGIFSFPVYTTQLDVAGKFDLSPLQALYDRDDVVNIYHPYLSVPVSDMRGINNKPVLAWQGKQIDFESGSQMRFNPQGLHVPMPNLSVGNGEFSYHLSLRGMDSFWFTPTAKDTQVTMSAAWPHPSFVGQFLPTERHIGTDKFDAKWQVSEFSSNIMQQLNECIEGECSALAYNRFGVTLASPIEIYSQSIRSTKYGLLFVGLTFVSFFVFEVLKQLRIHPIQYTLVALSLSVFYLLLIALSEHVGFLGAYSLATLACVSLLAFYIASILKNYRWGVGFGGLLTFLYGLLYLILSSEDHALMLGATLVFATLTIVMIATRHLDWYGISDWATEKAKAQLYKAQEEEHEETIEEWMTDDEKTPNTKEDIEKQSNPDNLPR